MRGGDAGGKKKVRAKAQQPVAATATFGCQGRWRENPKNLRD
jgi:hypothetical protein